MDLRDHLFYQELLTGQCTLLDAVRTLEKVIADTKAASLGELRAQAAAGAAEWAAHSASLDEADDDRLVKDPRTLYYGALLIHTVFSVFPDDRIRDYINLVHKETLARRISVMLRAEDVSLRDVEASLAHFTALPIGESQVSPAIAIAVRVQLITSFISDNLFYVGVAKFHITMRDVNALLGRFVGKYGQRCRVGGKSAGAILANRILKPAFGAATGFEDNIEETESYYLTSQIFYRFLEHNQLDEAHGLKYMDVEELEAVRDVFEAQFLDGRFPEDVRAQIREILTKLGEVPLIVRSSSLLEDSMGFPFYGKYASIFVTNRGPFEERFEKLVAAVKTVYVSILSGSVIEYRRDKNLLDYEDMMSVLIQRVVGSRHGRYFFPATSGVAFSRNQYRWSTRLDPTDGVARIVHGLGTRAVDRGGDDYPRLVSLGKPELRPEGTLQEKLKYSQRYVDVLNLESGALETIHFVDLYNEIRASGEAFQPAHAVSLVAEQGLESPLLYPDSLAIGGAAITFDNLLGSQFPALLKGMLKLLEKAYGVPVDVEFAVEGDKVYLLQCRPLHDGSGETARIAIPRPSETQRILFDARRDIFRSALVEDLRYIVYVGGDLYNSLASHADKLEVARAVGRVNRALKGERFGIMGPGRWGSVNLDLGVKVTYADINNSRVLAEIAFERGGYRPEMSYGTHFFQDLVEADIVPLPIYPGDGGSLDLGFLEDAPSALDAVLKPEHMPPAQVAQAVKVIDLDSTGPGRLSIYLSADESRGCGLLG